MDSQEEPNGEILASHMVVRLGTHDMTRASGKRLLLQLRINHGVLSKHSRLMGGSVSPRFPRTFRTGGHGPWHSILIKYPAFLRGRHERFRSFLELLDFMS